MQQIMIGASTVGKDCPPFIIAELSGNHLGSLEKAKELMHLAKESGVDAVKLQTYTPDTITLDINKGEFFIDDPKSLWYGKSLYELYQEASLPWEWHKPLFELGKKLDLIVFSTPFDESAVDFLEELHTPCYKVASPEIVDLPLITKIASTGKPILMSTGGANRLEISEAVATAKQAGCQQIILLKCTMAYPANPADIHLRTMKHLGEAFNVPVGLSDHTLGIGVAIASVALGGCVIEKHFTKSRAEGGVDSAFSMEPAEFKLLVEEAYRAWQSLGKVHYELLPSEKVAYSHRPSLYFTEKLEVGTVVGPEHIQSVRPGKGLPPKELSHILGLTLIQSVERGTPVSWKHFQH